MGPNRTRRSKAKAINTTTDRWGQIYIVQSMAKSSYVTDHVAFSHQMFAPRPGAKSYLPHCSLHAIYSYPPPQSYISHKPKECVSAPSVVHRVTPQPKLCKSRSRRVVEGGGTTYNPQLLPSRPGQGRP